MIIRKTAYPRAALIGNPSDGYHGKTIAFVFKNYKAEVRLYETPRLEIIPNSRDRNVFASIDALCKDVCNYGYYGGIRLLKAAVKKLSDYCGERGIRLPRKNFTMEYSSDIPNRLGLAGSSAIITAAMKGMVEFYKLDIDLAHMANIVLAAERDELGIPSGLQDRVAQAYNYPVYMDFNRQYMSRHQVGIYEKLQIPEELKLYVAYRTDLAEGSEVLHSRLRDDYENKVPSVLNAMKEWVALTDEFRDAMSQGRLEDIPALLNRNFDLRCEVCSSSISPRNLEMVRVARSVGASAKFTGSGGAIIGTYEDDNMYQRLVERLAELSICVIKPEIVYAGSGDLNR